MIAPNRWFDYRPIGQRMEGTKFIAFKVPLENYQNATFNTETVRKQIPNLGLVIDLTNSVKYYNPTCFTNFGIRYQKIRIRGQKIPDISGVAMFKKLVRLYLDSNTNNDKLIGVHCTHGVNRTGYLICNYLITVENWIPDEAIKKFNNARRHNMERDNYIEHLRSLTSHIPRQYSASKPPSQYNKQEDNSENKQAQVVHQYVHGNPGVSEISTNFNETSSSSDRKTTQ